MFVRRGCLLGYCSIRYIAYCSLQGTTCVGLPVQKHIIILFVRTNHMLSGFFGVAESARHLEKTAQYPYKDKGENSSQRGGISARIENNGCYIVLITDACYDDRGAPLFS